MLIFYGLLGSFVVNLGGNLHTIYLFTSGYPADSPIPFWKIFSGYNPAKYWYPNATRFIPFTMHEFPSYSYVVADLHGHVFDIPFVLLTLAILFVFFIKISEIKKASLSSRGNASDREISHLKRFLSLPGMTQGGTFLMLNCILIGFMTAIHYMTNAFDGPIYLLLTFIIFFALFGLSKTFFTSSLLTVFSFILFSFPFSYHFAPFVSGIGMNCSPNFLFKQIHTGKAVSYATNKIGPFLFEKGNCQAFVWWMWLVLWGFFLINFIMFYFAGYVLPVSKKIKDVSKYETLKNFMFILFAFGTLLVIIPEFFYIKDIYPAHFRANTMFKLGYQAFIIMGVASVVGLAFLDTLRGKIKYLGKAIFIALFFLIFLYPFQSFPSYYGTLKKTPQLDGSTWLAAQSLEDSEIVNYLNTHITGQPVILEAQGDSYSEYERISAYTGLPTVAGWWVHEWLWRGASDAVGKRIPDVTAIYESGDIKQVDTLLKKYHVQYIIVSSLEREKYKNIKEDVFDAVGTRLFESSNKLGALYQYK